MSEQSKRDLVVESLIPKTWDTAPYDWMFLIRDFLSSFSDVQITGSGTGNGFADCSFSVEGNSFWVDVRRVSRDKTFDLHGRARDE